ncbi:MAG: tetratricopeptide repeat protein, partial [Pseudomonadota bacterium]
RKLIGQYPDSLKVPDAFLNIASSQQEMGDSKASKQTLEDLLARYPQSEAAKKAKQRLANIR